MTIERFPFRAMASPCEVVIGSLTREAAARIADQAIAEVRRIEAKYSRFTDHSVIARINARAAHEPVELDDETHSLLAYASRIHEISGGLFDITTGLLQQAWDFRGARVANPSVLADLCKHVGWSRVDLGNGSIRLPSPRMRLDFGGFGKEYAADRAAGVLREAGVKTGYINLGGDLCAIGTRPDGEPWSIGIQHPRTPDALIASIPIADCALATSGDYERFFEHQGRRYCHILSPLTGQTVSAWQSVSVIAPQAITAGTTATIAMLLEDEALDFLHETRLAFLAVDANGNTFTHRSPHMTRSP